MKKSIRGILLTFIFGMFTVSQVFAIQQNHGHSVSGIQAQDDAREILESRIVKAKTSRIISVLDERIKDEDVLAKTREKLLTLNVEKIQLVSSLCDRVTESDGTPQADIVFSLVTALIVLS
jgi:hypothetical protein